LGKIFKEKQMKVGKAKSTTLKKIIAEDYRRRKKQFICVGKITK
tara:strand:+ start:261 stop:392 length:132 start_codon:yes stop_codon:yes gene_type:complete